MKLTASAIEPGNYLLTIASISEARDGRGAPCLRWGFVTEDGEPFTSFTPKRFGPRSNARAILEAAAGQRLGEEVETDTYIGRSVQGRLIVHPNNADDWRRRLAEVRPVEGDPSLGGLLAGPNGRKWDDVAQVTA